MKNLKVVMGSLLIAVIALGSFAFTSKGYHKLQNVKCFQFQPATPTSSNVVLPGSYLPVTTISCDAPRETFCAICIDIDANPTYVKSDGTLDFTVGALNTAVSTDWNVIVEGQSLNGVVFHYKSL